MSLRNAAVALFLVFTGWLSEPHPNARQPVAGQVPEFRSGVELVTVDVTVVDTTGQPVRGLNAGDFIVTVAGRSRRVATAEYVDAANTRAALQGADSVARVSTNEGGGVGRTVVFVVDSNTLETGEARQVAAAASQFLSHLTLADRSAVVSLPNARSIAFTWAHQKVQDALLRASGSGGALTTWEYGSLSEARDIATRGGFALTEVASRECGSATLNAGGIGGIGSSPSGGQSSPPGGGQSGSGGSGSGTTGSQTTGGGGTSGGSGPDQCLRELQNNAAMTWSMARANSLSSIAAFQDVLAALRGVYGDKTVVLISGGWPLEEHEQTTMMKSVSDEAAAARAAVYTLFVPHSPISASRRMAVSTQSDDQHLYYWALENLASMTGGRTFKADGAVGAFFERFTRELGGYYRLGVEKDPGDAAAKEQRMKVRVTRDGVDVRAREIFDMTRYEDRDWAARLASAVESPVPTSGLKLRLTSYVGADLYDPSSLRLVLAGDASRLQPGEANLLVVVRNLDGRKVATGDRQLGDADGTLPFATSLRVPVGTYMVRLALMDGAGRVGSVDHLVEVRPVSLGVVAVTGPLLVEVPLDEQEEPRFAVDGIHQGQNLAVEVGLTAGAATLDHLEVAFDIATTAEGPAIAEQPGTLSPERGTNSVIAQGVVNAGVLPPGEYYARAKIKANGDAVGEVRRAFRVFATPGSPPK